MTIAFFVLGPLPQALKLLSASGLPWTKTWTVIFSLAWLIEVILRFIAGMKFEVTRDNRGIDLKNLANYLRQSSKMIYQVAFIVQIAVWIWILTKLAATPVLCGILGAMLLGLAWVCSVGFLTTLALVVILLVPIFINNHFNTSPFRRVRAIVMCAAIVGVLPLWTKYGWTADWFSGSLLWVFNFISPVGFVVALILLPPCAVLFVWACTAILIGLDAILVKFGQKLEERDPDALESQSLLPRGEEPQQQASTATTTVSDAVPSTTAEPHASSTIAMDTLAQNTPLPPSRATTGFTVPTNWWLRLTALSESLERGSGKWTFHYRGLDRAQRRRVQAIAFALANLFFVSLWYWGEYDPEETEKAGWTDMFG